jgi:hypothetical protein
MNFFLLMLAFAALCLVQNAVFTAVSRSRNSGDVRHHAKWALGSNGIFFVMQIFLMGTIWKSIEAGSYWQIAIAGLVYTVCCATGSVWMMAKMLKTETGKRRVGAQAEENKPELWQTLAFRGQSLDAMREYRLAHGVSLKDAHDAVRAYEAKGGAK